LDYQRERIDVRRLTAGSVIFALVVKVGGEVVTEFSFPPSCDPVSCPTLVL